MKAYLRFRMPFEIARTFSDNVRDTFQGRLDLVETKKPSTFHVTLAYFDNIRPEDIPSMNDAIATGCIKFRSHPPIIKLCGYDILEHGGVRRFVALAEVEPFKLWEERRTYFLNEATHFAPEAFRETWNPHVTLGTTNQSTLPEMEQEIPTYFTWKPDRVELVLKTYPGDAAIKRVDLILPAWHLDDRTI